MFSLDTHANGQSCRLFSSSMYLQTFICELLDLSTVLKTNFKVDGLSTMRLVFWLTLSLEHKVANVDLLSTCRVLPMSTCFLLVGFCQCRLAFYLSGIANVYTSRNKTTRNCWYKLVCSLLHAYSQKGLPLWDMFMKVNQQIKRSMSVCAHIPLF